MANNSTTNNENLFSSLISDIKTYNGSDPLLPWLRGIKKMTDVLPQQLLKQKLPRFLQKCAQTFERDLRYRNDLRYLRVWMKLLDFVDDPGAVLENMKENHIGNKRSLFYQAYALYYEKLKKFNDAEKMFHLGVQNFAEPQDELQKSFEQFLHRMERYKNKKTRVGLMKNKLPSAQPKPVEDKKVISPSMEDEKGKRGNIGCEVDEHAGENTVVVRFTKTAIVGKSKAEDARHNGLVEPTINTKEAMDAINSMFREPLASDSFQKHNPQKGKENAESFMVFNDNESGRPVDEPFQIYCDENDNEENIEDQNEKFEHKVAPSMTTKAPFVFQIPNEVPVECPQGKFREDTVMLRFVGSTISDEPKVENVCHHGLVEPTVNLKEAMDDINGMFGKPIEFVRKRRPRKQEKQFEEKKSCSSFLILPDDESENFQEKSCKPSGLSSRKENDLFEQTVCTKEAMDDINKMFAMPLDF